MAKQIPRAWLVVWLTLPFVIVALLWILVLEPSRTKAKPAPPDHAPDAPAPK